MNRAIGALLVYVSVLVMAGCSSMDMRGFLGLGSTPDGNERVVAGNLDAVVETTKASLTRMNLKASVTNVGQTAYIDTTLQNGARFRFVLTRETSSAGERTRIRVEWLDSRRNEEITFGLLSDVESKHRN
jgi:hypothetical protein